MNHDTMPAYGLWSLVVINSVIFIFFALSFFKPKTKLDWRAFNGFAAFIIALFVEMYGFPLTIYFFSGWLTGKYPQVDFLSHDSGHLLSTLLGLKGNPHFSVLHIASNICIIVGFIIISQAWSVLHHTQQNHQLATTGLYAHVRHPQYDGFILIMFGFLLQWPTIITFAMFPVLVAMYFRLAKQEEHAIEEEFGGQYHIYQAQVPAFFPRWKYAR